MTKELESLIANNRPRWNMIEEMREHETDAYAIMFDRLLSHMTRHREIAVSAVDEYEAELARCDEFIRDALHTEVSPLIPEADKYKAILNHLKTYEKYVGRHL